MFGRTLKDHAMGENQFSNETSMYQRIQSDGKLTFTMVDHWRDSPSRMAGEHSIEQHMSRPRLV